MIEKMRLSLMKEKLNSLLLMLVVAIGFGVLFSFYTVWIANAAVTEAALIDYPTSSGITRVKPGGRIVPLVFGLTQNAGEKLVSTTFQINTFFGITSSDFNSDPAIENGAGLYIVKDDNPANDQIDASDSRIAFLPGSALSINATTTINIDTDLNSGNGLQGENLPASLNGAWDYALMFVMSTTTSNFESFSVSVSSTSESYRLNSGTVNSVGMTSLSVMVDTMVPTVQSTNPPNNATFVPPDALMRKSFSEAILPSSVTSTGPTTTVRLQANIGNTQLGAPTGSNLCTSVTLQNNNADVVCNHSMLATSTWYTFTFTTGTTDIAGNAIEAMSTSTFQTGSFNANNNNTPPFIVNSFPNVGSQDFPTNGNLLVEFPQGNSGNMMLVDAGSVTSTTNVVLQAVIAGAPSGANICASNGCTLSWDVASRKLKIDPTVNLSASTQYALMLSRNIKNAANIGLNGGMNDFLLFFTTASGADSTAPTFSNMVPAQNVSGVALNTGEVLIQFSEQMDATMATTSARVFVDSNANSAMNAGEELNNASSTFRYDSFQKAVHIGFKSLLQQNTRYCALVTTAAADTVGNTVAGNTVKCFTTTASAYVATAPTVMFADADNFKLWVSFDQPVDPTTALTKSNYTVESPLNTVLDLTNATLVYRPEAKGVEITGLGLTTGQVFKVSLANVKDISGTQTIFSDSVSNVGQGTVQNANNTGGFVGGVDKPDFKQSTNFGSFWEKPQRCSPNSQGAGKSGRFTCEFPTTASLSSGAKIILTFPNGFSIASSSLVSAANSFMNADINGPGPGVTTLSAISTSTGSNTVTLTVAHSGTAMGSSDQLRFEIDGITNSATAGEYSISIIVKDSSGVKLGQTINASPFVLGSAGAYSISGKVCKGTTSGGACGGGDTGIQNVKVFLDAPGVGHQEATTASNGSYSFTGLNAGSYNLGMFIDPTIAADVGGGNNFQNVTIINANLTGIDFKKTDVSSTGKTLTVSITGAPASTDMSVFCFAPGNVQFSAPVMKKVTSNGAGAASGSLKLQPNTTYQCGIGPFIPFDTFSSGGPPPVPDFTFVPPQPKTIVVENADLATSFALVVSSMQIVGKVTDGSGTAIANVFVDARPLGCFDTTTGALKDCQGSFAQTKSDGTFILKVSKGTYEVSACSPGMPCTSETEATVKDNNDGTDGNTTADVYVNGTIVTGNGIVIKMNKTSLTIAGTVSDESGNAIKYAFVNAQKITAGGTCTSFTSQGGQAGSPTDSSGNYTLYVTNGTWRVEAFAGAYGQVGCTVVTMSGSSLTGKNLSATAGDYGTISGTVTKGGTAVQGAQINCFGSAGGNSTMSGADGSYSIKVKSGNNYRCDGFIPGAGPLTPATALTVTASQTTTANLSMGNPGIINVNLGSVTDAFCDARDANGKGNGNGQNDEGVYTIYVPAGTYTVRCGNPKIGQIGSQSVVVVAGETNTVTFTPPTLFVVSGIINNGASNLEGASLALTDKTNGRIIFTQSSAAAAGNNVSVSLPAGTYAVTAMKSGYIDAATAETLVVSAATSFTTRSLTKASISVSATVQLDGSNYTGEARVIATKSDGRVVTTDVDETDTDGANTTILLTNGTWSLVAFADNGKKSAAATVNVVGGVADASPTLSLSTDITGFTATKSQQQAFTPSNGGLFRDVNIGSNFEISVPAGALSTSDSTAGTIETKTNPTLAIDTPGKDFLGSAAIDITPKNSSGQKLSESTSEITFKIPYTESDIPAGVDETELQCATWSDAAGDWETLSTSVDTTNNVVTCRTTHFSSFGVVAATSGGTSSSGGGQPGGGGGGGGGNGNTVPVVTTPSIKIPVSIESPKVVSPVDTKNTITPSPVAAPNSVVQAYMFKKLLLLGSRGDEVKKLQELLKQLGHLDKNAPLGNFGPATFKAVQKFQKANKITALGTVGPATRAALNKLSVSSPSVEVIPAPVTVPTPVVSVPTPVFKNTLKVGSRGVEVKQLQQILKNQGHFNQEPNGVFGPATFKAVQKFQKANKITQLGTVGPATRKALNSI